MTTYKPTWESLDDHPVPEWYEDAKLGIFVHWYPNAVPGYGFGWYAHDMHLPEPADQIDDKDVHAYHREHYGAPTEAMAEDGEPVFEYSDFVRETAGARDPDATENFGAETFDPEEWAELFDAAGARYVVPVAEHHDGFPMWDADYTDWTAAEMGPERDVIADLSEAIRDRDLKFAGSHHRMYCFYDHRYEGMFGHPDYEGPVYPGEQEGEGPGEEFVEEWLATLEAMFEHHEPDLLWLDGDWGAEAETFRSKELLAEYYNRAEEWGKEVVANDRLGRTRWKDDDPHGDFYTPEYAKFDRTIEHKWETCRSLGDAWTYDRTETADDLLSVTALVRNFVDVVAKNGNMLINVGPRPDGTIPEIQAERLRGLGDWLSVNGEGVYDSRYWVTPEDETGGVAARYTTRDEFVYAFCFGWPTEARLEVAAHVDRDPVAVELLRVDDPRPLEWTVANGELVVELPEEPPDGTHEAAYCLRVQVALEGERAMDHANVEPDVVTSTEEMQSLASDDYDASDWEI